MNLLDILLFAVPAVFEVTVHEIAHGYIANHLGDSTARDAGRLSLNPIRHIDPIGTILVPASIFLASSAGGLLPRGFMFGWARPVPVDWTRLKSPRRDIALVAIAGPAANLLMLLGWFGLLQLAFLLGNNELWLACRYGILFNATIMLLNLLPVPPLDGSRVVSSMLPPRAAVTFNRIEPYGLVVLLILVFSGVLGLVLGPAISGFELLTRLKLV